MIGGTWLPRKRFGPSSLDSSVSIWLIGDPFGWHAMIGSWLALSFASHLTSEYLKPSFSQS